MKMDQFPRRPRRTLGDGSELAQAVQPVYVLADSTPVDTVPVATGDCGSCALMAQAQAASPQNAMMNTTAVAAPAAASTAGAAAPASPHEWLWIGLGLLGLWYFSKPKREG